MANNVLNWAWSLRLDPMQKLVLIALSDRADENGYCYPGISWIMRATGASERTVQRAIRDLDAADYLRRNQKPGRGCEYFLNVEKNSADPRHADTPVREAPPSDCREPPSGRHPTPVREAPHPRHADTQSLNNPTVNPQEPNFSLGKVAGPSKSKQSAKSTRGELLPSDWQPKPSRDVLELIAAWPEGQFENALVEFRCHALDNGRTSHNWNAAFDRWLVTRDRLEKQTRKGGRSGRTASEDGLCTALDRRLAASMLESGEWTKAQAQGFIDGSWTPPDHLDHLLNSSPAAIDGDVIDGKARILLASGKNQ